MSNRCMHFTSHAFFKRLKAYTTLNFHIYLCEVAHLQYEYFKDMGILLHISTNVFPSNVLHWTRQVTAADKHSFTH